MAPRGRTDEGGRLLATFVLIHGAASDSRDWDLLAPELEALGHAVVAPDLPCDDDSAGLSEYADTVVEAIGERRGVVLVAHSFGGFTAPLVAVRMPVELLVMLNAMVPSPGEPPGDWWSKTGWPGRSAESKDEMMDVFLHDVSPELARATMNRAKDQSGTPFVKAWPLAAWPDVSTKVLVGRDDRFLPVEFQRRLARDRLGVAPDEIDGGHVVALSRPKELAYRLDEYLRGA